ncbi:beta-ketoacyl-ACP synthase 3, partial [Kocuria rosea]|uniref:beta-ketoacyl-ACP synthase 3 n=1 Tax=Kocuria rosea TaxID=1275 RepID=UPI0011756BC4
TNAHSRILGLGVYRPDVVVTNDDVCQWIESSDEWIQQRTGIRTRHRAAEDVSVLDMSEHAAREALAAAGIEASQLGAVIVSTISFPYLTPSAAAALANAWAPPRHRPSTSSAACRPATATASPRPTRSSARGRGRHIVLVIGVEKLSDVIDNTERSISFRLGDGAGAVVIGPSDTPRHRPVRVGLRRLQVGRHPDDPPAHRHPGGGAGARAGPSPPTFLDPETGAVREDATLWPTLRQDGQTVFRWASWEVAKRAQEAMDVAGVRPEDLSAFIPHQANMRIIDQMAKTLKLPESVVIARDIADSGNTSAASVPLATHRLLAEHPELSGKLALQIGFGAGLVYGAQVVVLP